MASRRLRNSGLKILSSASRPRLFALRERSRSVPDGAGAHLPGSGVGRHDQDHLAEVGLAPVVVGEGRMVHHLEQDVEEVVVGLLDLVEEHDAVGMRPDGVDQQAALLEADVPGRSPDEAGDGVLLHELAHVEAVELVSEVSRELLGQLGLAHARGPAEQEASRGMVRVPEARPGALDGLGHDAHRFLLPEDHPPEGFLEGAQALALRDGGLLLRDPRHPRDDGSPPPRRRRVPRLRWSAGVARPRLRRCTSTALSGSRCSRGASGRGARLPRGPRRSTRLDGGPRSETSGPSVSRGCPRRTARPPRSSGGGGGGRGPSRCA